MVPLLSEAHTHTHTPNPFFCWYLRLGRSRKVNFPEQLWQCFYEPDAYPVAQLTASKHWMMIVFLIAATILPWWVSNTAMDVWVAVLCGFKGASVLWRWKAQTVFFLAHCIVNRLCVVFDYCIVNSTYLMMWSLKMDYHALVLSLLKVLWSFVIAKSTVIVLHFSNLIRDIYNV